MGNKYLLPTLDHIIPLSKGGQNTIDNMQTLCINCNGNKKDKLPLPYSVPEVLEAYAFEQI